jgi:hypothetical protein
MMLIRHGTPCEKRADNTEFVPYSRDPLRLVSAVAVRVSWSPWTV